MSRCSGAAKQLKNQQVAAQAVSRDTIYCQKQATLTPLPRRHCSRIFTLHLTAGTSLLCDIHDIIQRLQLLQHQRSSGGDKNFLTLAFKIYDYFPQVLDTDTSRTRPFATRTSTHTNAPAYEYKRQQLSIVLWFKNCSVSYLRLIPTRKRHFTCEKTPQTLIQAKCHKLMYKGNYCDWQSDVKRTKLQTRKLTKPRSRDSWRMKTNNQRNKDDAFVLSNA